MNGNRRYRIRVTGIVQGVGFRPTVYRYALENELGGFVRNDSDGVVIEVEGKTEALDAFVTSLRKFPPPLARIDRMEEEEIPCREEKTFSIHVSDDTHKKRTPVSPDVSICPACIEEMRDPADRRFGHPFINCTDCGPRYTITRTVPYDRPNTSMASFEMCDMCRTEYENPEDRRYHAQPIACRDCGPRLRLLDSGGVPLHEGEVSIDVAVRYLEEGRIVAVKGLGGFHLMCRADDDRAVRSLRERKRRPSKPLAVMVRDLDIASGLAVVGEDEARLLEGRERPIVLLSKHRETDMRISSAVAPGIDRLGIMLPYTPLHILLFDRIDKPLVATSANLSDEPIVRDADTLLRKLGGVVDAVLDHDREIVNACDDSVVQVVAGRPVWLRAARGVAPMTIPLDFTAESPILAVGANQKTTISLALDDRIVVSPHIGDLDGIESMEYFERTVETFRRFYDFVPEIVVCDKHPGYETTKWAMRLADREGIERVAVQHHYAHALAVMAEHGLREEAVLAFCWDGTGYGEDGTFWGSEALIADASGFRRVASLAPFGLIGGEKAVREPRRVALSMFFEVFGETMPDGKSPLFEAFGESEIELLAQVWRKGLRTPRTTSMGRFFDAVASFCGLCQRLGFEGESGMRIEAMAEEGHTPWPMPLEEGMWRWDAVVEDLCVSPDPIRAASKLMATLEAMIFDLADRHPDLPLLFAGGVFQNRTLLSRLVDRCEKEGRRFYLPRRLPPNDGAISLGQIWYALYRRKFS
ncbi:carbamoyltransferase HypF [Hydrogenimonas sp.]